MPDEVVQAAREVYRRRRRGEVAVLVFDSLVDADAPPEDHQLRFEHPGLSVAVQLSAGAESTSLSVVVNPPQPERAELQFEGGGDPIAAPLREGRTRFEAVPHRIIRLTFCGAGDLPTIRTDWFRV